MARLASAVSTVQACKQGWGTCLDELNSSQRTGTCSDKHWQWTLLAVWLSLT